MKLGLRTRLLALALIPCLGLAALVADRALTRREAAREADDLALLVRLTVIIGDLLHETQKERGSSSLFMSSNGTKFVRELPAQRALTDDKRVRYMQFVRSNDAAWPPAVIAALRLADAQLNEIETRRRQATEISVPVPEIIGYYNELNRRLLASVASIASKSSDADLRGWSTGYFAFLHAKEYTGIERANLSNVFGSDHFAPGQYFTVASLVASQRAYLHIFASLAPPEVTALHEEKTRHPAFAEVEAKERIAFDGGPAAGAKGGFGVDSTVWFKVMTQKIDLQKEVENAMAAAILERAASMQAAAAAALQKTLAVGLALVLGVFGAAALVARRIVAPIRRLKAVADQVSSGDLEQEVATDAPGEIGELAQSFRRMVNSLKMMRAMQKKSAAPGRMSGSRPLLRS